RSRRLLRRAVRSRETHSIAKPRRPRVAEPVLTRVVTVLKRTMLCYIAGLRPRPRGPAVLRRSAQTVAACGRPARSTWLRSHRPCAFTSSSPQILAPCRGQPETYYTAAPARALQ